MNPLHFASISGGADSLATALLAIERAEKRDMNLRFLNADLGANESQITHDYDEAVAWAKTSRGGKQFDLLQRLARDQAAAEGAMCESAYGLCE